MAECKKCEQEMHIKASPDDSQEDVCYSCISDSLRIALAAEKKQAEGAKFGYQRALRERNEALASSRTAMLRINELEKAAEELLRDERLAYEKMQRAIFELKRITEIPLGPDRGSGQAQIDCAVQIADSVLRAWEGEDDE